MAFADLKPQAPRTPANTRHPERATWYGAEALRRSAAAATATRTVLDVPFGADDEQRLDLYLPPDPAARGVPVLLFFHGGAWAHGYKEWNGFMAPALVDLPAIFVSVSYRLLPDHRFPAALDDAVAGLAWVHAHIAKYGGDPARLFVAGWSAGGTLAALVALRRELYARHGLPTDVVKGCAPSSTGFVLRADVPAPGNRGWTYRQSLFSRPGDDRLASPLAHVHGDAPAFFISYGANDFPHVIATSTAMAGSLTQHGVPLRLRVYPDADHYQNNLDQGRRNHDWADTMRRWMAAGRLPP
ncbi:MAG: alpha/beta hydrolase [Alphaproteobacteria bacterium]|nr:alpha/beta hydrolase [Alphaproteobacteria bacterium]